MRVAPPHPREKERLRLLTELDGLIQAGDPRLTNIAAIAAEVCGTPIGVVSLVDFDRQYFVGRVGLEASSTTRDVAFCAHAILGTDLFEVEDATKDPRFAQNPLVTGSLGIRQYSGVPLESDEGVPLGTLCVIGQQPGQLGASQRRVLERLASEVTAIVQSHRRIRSLESERAAHGELVARLVHDLKAPLKSVHELSRLLKERPDPAHAETLFVATTHLQRVADELLDGSSDAPTPVELKALLEEQVALGRTLVQPDVELLHKVSPRLPPRVELPPTAMQRVLTNLVANAARFTDSGHITVLAEVVDKRLLIAVQDTGRGIEASALTTIFEPRSVAAPGGGSQQGLGLAIVKDKVEAMGGRVSITSALGRGTRITLDLPLVAATPAKPEPTTRVLVVDDVAVNRLVAERHLSRCGVHAEGAADGLQALEALETQSFDAVLLDYYMPGPSGPDITRRIRALLGKHVGIYGWTGSAEAELRDRFLRAGADDVITKPLDRAQLDRLFRHLDKRRSAAKHTA